MRIYLDNCCYNRPFDEQDQIQVKLETLAKLHIQEQIRLGKHDLVWSNVLDYENMQNPFDERRESIAPWRKIAVEIVSSESEDTLTLAESLEKEHHFKTYDALHVACAIKANCSYFITTDKKLIRENISKIRIVNPVMFIDEMGGESDET
ncbi:MAG: PIN domain-containing protein [Bacillota bacterium]|nr:PIN domain-containing protein [Bacillota bacterium]